MRNVLLFPTMRCNLECSYCHFRAEQSLKQYHWQGYGKDHFVESEVDPKDVIKFLDKLGPSHIEFSGGEPTLHKGFREIVANVNADSRWAITSNTLIDPAGIDFSKCLMWTASWHAGGDREKFKKHIKWLRQKMGRVSISFVVPFDKVEETIIKAIGIRAELNVSVNLLRELNEGIDWRKTKEWETLISMKGNGFNVVEEDIPPAWSFSKNWLCNGGGNYLSIMPDGAVFRCYSEAMDGSPIGTIYEFEPNTETYECRRECYGCALDHHSRIMRLSKD